MPSSPTSLSASRVDELAAAVSEAFELADASSANANANVPVHVVYGGAHLFRADSAAKLGKIARAAMDTWGKDDALFAKLVRPTSAGGAASKSFATELAGRVREKLAREPIEKTCIDFEDGYGPRGDEEEDADAVRAAGELANAARGERPVIGIRVKAFTPATVRRAARTLDLFLTALVHGAPDPKRALPAGFTVTLPKVARPAEVTALADALVALEASLGLESGSIGIELMVETPRAIVDVEGKLALPALVAASGGRCVAAHLGAYDLTASLGVTAGEQRLDHPACDVARLLMQMSLAGTGVVVVDGATTVLPTARHRETPDAPLTDAQRAINAGDVHAAWALHAGAIAHALRLGIYQGWDLHPAQLPARYGAVYAFFLAERAAMAARLRAFVGKATQAMRSGQVFDDAATGQGMLEFFVRGVACGALDDDDVKATGLTIEELRGRSFARIVAARGGSGASQAENVPR